MFRSCIGRRVGVLGPTSLALFLSLCGAAQLAAAPVVRTASGPDAAAIQSAVDQFRDDLGGGDANANVQGSFMTGRREINWDGVPDGAASPNLVRSDFFNRQSPRGIELASANNNFRVSADADNPTGTPIEFGDLNAAYPAIFKPFSAQRLFAPSGSTVTDVQFYVPGSRINASVSAFGVVFTDVDNATATTVQFLTSENIALATVTAPVADDGLSFVGVTFNGGERVDRVRITTGNVALGAPDVDGSGSASDVVVMDDFIYSEPVPYPDVLAVHADSGALLQFNARSPEIITATYTLNGLTNTETLDGIDFRPATGQLYGLALGGSSARLVTIPLGGANQVTQVGSPFAISGTTFGFDFNPVADRIRITSDAKINLSVDPNDAAVTTQTPLNPGNPNIGASAYTNSVAGATTTSLYGIDIASNMLVLQNPPASGTLTNVGPLGADALVFAGLDIQPFSNAAYSTLTLNISASTRSLLFSVDLDDGSARSTGLTIGSGVVIRSMALIPQSPSNFTAPPPTQLAAVDFNNNLLLFSSNSPGDVTTVPVTGLLADERLEAIDFRPVNRVLYGLGILNPPGNNNSEGHVYTINLSTGAATPVAAGNAPFSAAFNDVGSFGFDFNPVADRIRVVNSANQSLRVNPNDGTLTAVDFNLNAQQPAAVAYDRNDTDAATPTTLYGLEFGTSNLIRIGGVDGLPSPNGGTVTTIGPLGTAMQTAFAGFDISSDTGTAFAAYSNAHVSNPADLLVVNLQTGTAFTLGAIGVTGSNAVRGLAVVPREPAQLANISTRARVETGDNVLIGGFIVSGAVPKRLIVRALGPSLAVPGPLANPTLELYDSGNNLIASNDNWRDTQQAEIEATTIPPANDLAAAIVRSLNPGAYTAVMRGVDDGTGVGLIELYDLDLTAAATLANISTRGRVLTGDDVMIGGVIVSGSAAQKVIVRAIGPSLGIGGQLEDPLLEVYDGNGALLTSNNNWKDSQQAEIEMTTIPPANDLESAIVATLPPAAYTAVVRGVDDTTGVALVEVYALD